MINAIVQAQGYLYFLGTVALTVFLYWYAYYLWTSKKKGRGDYERYSDLVLHDSIQDKVVDPETPNKTAQDKTQP